MKIEMALDEFIKILNNKELILSTALIRLLGIIIFSIFIALGAFIYLPLPFTPVPVTLQTFFVLLSGLVLYRKDATLSQILYIFLGSLGIPVFVGIRAGFISLTTGYLVGFIFAAWIIGVLSKKNNSLFGLVPILVFADITILTLGTLWLSLFLKINILEGFKLGFLPFLLGDSLKIILVISVYRIYKKMIT